MLDSINQFIDGQEACRAGKPCPVDASEAFKRGYQSQKDLQALQA